MQVQESHYIFPPRAKTAIPFNDAKDLYTDLEWIAQLKYNDSRCLIKILADGTIELWNRHAEKFRSYNPPSWLIQQILETAEKLNLNGYCLLDGGLLDQKHSAIKDTLVIWDILVKDGQHLLNTTYQERYQQLNPRTPKHWDSTDETAFIHEFPTITAVLGEKLNENIFIPRLIKAPEWQEAWGMMQEVNKPYLEVGNGPALEGFVFKDKEGVLEMGWREKNNDSWQARSRVATGRHAF